MRCGDCGTENARDRRFCGGCGATLTSACPACGFANTPDALFCGGCGLRSYESDNPGRYGSAQAGRPAGMADIEAEHKQVTVLFADIKSSLELINSLDTEQACAVLNGALQVMVEVVQRYHGTVNQVLGDGIMALFGAPRAQEDHAIRACQAAWAILSGVQALHENGNAGLLHALQIRIGISSGDVLVRVVRSDMALPYTAVGVTAHLASRMESLAQPGTAYLTEDTARLVGEHVQLKTVGPVSVKGLDRKLTAYQLTGVTDSANRFRASLTRGLTQFVGRQQELAQLHEIAGKAASGRGQMVTIAGEPGIGKSRLCHEFSHSPQIQGHLVLRAEAASYGTPIPWLLTARVLRAYFEVAPDDGTHVVRDKVTAGLRRLDPGLLAYEVPLLACLDVARDDKTWEDLRPAERRDRIQAALIAVMKQIGESRPTLLILEDLHNADQESAVLLTALAAELPSTRLVVLLTHRPQIRLEMPPEAPVTAISLEQLWEKSVNEMLTSLLGTEPALAPLKSQIAAKTEGNPFFIEETVRELRHSGVLLGAPGAQQLTQALPDTLIPPTVQATIASRIDRLSFEDKMVLRCASAFGEVADLRMLSIVTSMQDKPLRSSLDRLRILELLSEATALPANSCRFRHALTRDVAYNSLAAWRKTALHQRIVQAIEEVGDVQSSEVLALVAAHALDGQLWAKAFRCWSELADRAMARSASGDALAACRNAELALQNLEPSEDTDRKKLDLFFLQIDAHFARGDHAEVSDHIDRAYKLAERLGDQPKLLRALSLKAFRSWLNGEPAEAIKAGRKAYKIASGVDSPDLRVNTAVRLGIYFLARGDYTEAIEPFEAAIHAIPDSQISERFGLVSIASAAARSALARTLGERLQFDRGRALASEAMSIAERYNHPFTLLYVTQEIGILYLRAGDLEEAVRVLSIGHRIALTMPVNLLRPAVMSELGAALVESGQLVQGIELLSESVDCARALRLRPQFGQQLGYLARGYLLAGDLQRATSLAQEALGCTLAYDERGDEAWIRLLLAEIAEQGDPAEAQKLLAEVRRLAKRRGYGTLEKLCQEKLLPKVTAETDILPFAAGAATSEQQERRAAGAQSTGN